MTDKIKEEVLQEEELKESAETETDAGGADTDVSNGAETGGENADAEAAEENKDEKEDTGKEEDGDARYLRLMADFQNYKKRVEKEKKDLYAYANEKIMSELLSVIDNFERALQQEAGDGFKEGMEMIFKQLGDVLEKSGLAEIAAQGEDFDPNVHNAVMTEETEEYESGKVSGVMQKGYTLNGKVIRPSMVKVAQ